MWRSRAGIVVDHSALGVNDDVTCFGLALLERERPLGPDKRRRRCLTGQTVIFHSLFTKEFDFRWVFGNGVRLKYVSKSDFFSFVVGGVKVTILFIACRFSGRIRLK